ncbi:hypothetical protein FBU59_003906 [Linderina macrospora]|uniref:Uncharacterized protein n=1 Tax=Linderina macrospora TaxID=4868 RepID=A0ACC1J750_9FUNG|nr:hypothetical protein FBU59_003906 [Linderina macrospora]
MADFISQRAGQLSELKVMFPFNGSIDMDKLRLNSIDALRTLFSGGGGKILELPQLRTLGLYVDSALASQPVPMEQHAASLLFPSLTHLKLLGKGRVMRDCVSLVSLGQIKQLSLGEEVDVSNNDITMFTGLETLRLCLNMTDVLREKVCRKHWIQNLMSSKIYAKRLVIDGEDLNGSKTTELNRVVYTLQRCITARVTTLLMPPIVQLRDLQELDVRAILQSGSLVKLLKRLPSLRRLHLRVYACISSGVLGPEYTHERKAPTYSYINRTVEFVETTFFEGTGEDKEQTYHIAWLIARMPGLKRWWCVPHKRKLTRKVLKDIAAERRFCFDVKHIRPLLKKM